MSNCSNGLLDGNETGVDCGGGTCEGCPQGEECLVDDDCDNTLNLICTSHENICLDVNATLAPSAAPTTVLSEGECLADCEEMASSFRTGSVVYGNVTYELNTTCAFNATDASCYMTLRTPGIPDHYYYDPNGEMIAQSFEEAIPVNPTPNMSKTWQDPYSQDTLPSGEIGFAINGVALFSPLSVDGVDPLYPPDGYPDEQFDNCLCHPEAAEGIYHCHIMPPCLYGDDQNADEPSSWKHPYTYGTYTASRMLDGWDEDFAGFPSPLIGYILDGFPIYGPYDENGDAQTGLDNCNGKFTDGNYAYYATETFPYLIGCYGPGVCDDNANMVAYSEYCDWMADCDDDTAVADDDCDATLAPTPAPTVTPPTPAPTVTPSCLEWCALDIADLDDDGSCDYFQAVLADCDLSSSSPCDFSSAAHYDEINNCLALGCEWETQCGVGDGGDLVESAVESATVDASLTLSGIAKDDFLAADNQTLLAFKNGVAETCDDGSDTLAADDVTVVSVDGEAVNFRRSNLRELLQVDSVYVSFTVDVPSDLLGGVNTTAAAELLVDDIVTRLANTTDLAVNIKVEATSLGVTSLDAIDVAGVNTTVGFVYLYQLSSGYEVDDPTVDDDDDGWLSNKYFKVYAFILTGVTLLIAACCMYAKMQRGKLAEEEGDAGLIEARRQQARDHAMHTARTHSGQTGMEMIRQRGGPTSRI